MSKTSVIIGLILSVGIHATIFWPRIRQADRVSEHREHEDPVPAERIAVRVLPVPEPPVPEPAPEAPLPALSKPPAPEAAVAAPPPAEQPREIVKHSPVPRPHTVHETPPARPAMKPVSDAPPALEKVVRPGADVADLPMDATGDAAEETDDALPTLRIEWRSARQLKSVARAFGMRIIAVDSSSAIVGEISMMGAPALVTFEGHLSSFSNRVRTLAPDYFGPVERWDSGRDIAALWILVPADIDRNLISTQREAIRQAGRQVQEVRVTEGRFEAYGNSYRLVITNVL